VRSAAPVTTDDGVCSQQLDDAHLATGLMVNGAPRASVLAIADRMAARCSETPEDRVLQVCVAYAMACADCCEPAKPGSAQLFDEARRVLGLVLEDAGLIDAG
jgi:hypothetical protein